MNIQHDSHVQALWNHIIDTRDIPEVLHGWLFHNSEWSEYDDVFVSEDGQELIYNPLFDDCNDIPF